MFVIILNSFKIKYFQALQRFLIFCFFGKNPHKSAKKVVKSCKKVVKMA